MQEEGFYGVNKALLSQKNAFGKLLVSMQSLEGSLKTFNNFLAREMKSRY